MDPAPEPPVAVRLTTLGDVACPYLPGRTETLRAVRASRIDGPTYHAFLDSGFRRSGRMLYQPVCRDCRECRSLRVPVATFVPTASQRRCVRRNRDLQVSVDRPVLTDEKAALYARYQATRHARDDHAGGEADTADALRQFLYDSPTDTLEFVYHLDGRVAAVGVCDVSPLSLSSVYFYFDPGLSARSPGTYGALYEIEWCRRHDIGHYYLGYWVRDCPAMTYKANFGPAELLDATGQWRPLPRTTGDCGPDRVPE